MGKEILSDFSYLYWDPNPEMFRIDLPFLHRGILWYGFLFALGFFIGYWIFLYLARRHFLFYPEFRSSLKKRSLVLTERVTIYVVIGALIGSRLGDIIFYQDWTEIAKHPLSIFYIWEGGLASHGGVIGIFVALWILSKKINMSLLKITDLVVIPTALAGMCIRIGNFFNQEILGIPTQLPWGIIFGHPMDREEISPRHPAQLYEALWYGLVFLFLISYFKRHARLEKPGRITGLFFVLVFAFRFCIEYIKVEQSRLLSAHSLLTMGQCLSIPVIVLGLFLLYKTRKHQRI